MAGNDFPYDQIESVVAEIVRARCPLADGSYAENLFDLGIQSMDLIAICALVEERLGILLDVAEVIEEPSVSGISRVVGSKVSVS